MGNATSAIVRSSTAFGTEAPAVYPDYVSSPVEELHKDFMNSVCALLLQHGIFWQRRRKEPPIRFRKPETLAKLIDYRLRETGTSHPHLLDLLRRILYFTPSFSHPYYMYQLLSGLDPYAVIGDFVVCASPSTMLSYRDGPVYHMMEQEISAKLRELVGYPKGVGECIFTPGTAMGTVTAFLLARHYKFPETKTEGAMHLPPLVAFTSQDGHCCFQKGAIYSSFGLDNICLVKTDDKGRMCPKDLERCIELSIAAKKVPVLVTALCGTNTLGAFDPLEEIHRICKKHGIWFHSDAALGSGMIVSEVYRQKRLRGMELCDSFAGNFHKLGSAAQVCSFLLTRHSNILKEAYGLGFSSEDYSSYDTSSEIFHSECDVYDSYLDHTRRPDIVKLFMMWKGKGLYGLGANVEDAFERSKFLLEEIKRRRKENGKFVPLLEEFESPLISFYYIPTYLQRAKDRSSPDFKERLNLHTSFLLAELINEGLMVITAQSLRSSPLFFKIITFNSSLTKTDIIYLLDQIDNHGAYLRLPFETPESIVRGDPDMNYMNLKTSNNNIKGIKNRPH